MNPTLQKLNLSMINRPLDFQVGDWVRVHYKIVEGDKERLQTYEGLVIAIQNQGISKTFTVRRISFDVGVERIFPLYSPFIEKIEVVRSHKVRRAKLYYLRKKVGKESRLKEIRRKGKKDPIFEKAQALRQNAAS
ncbi:MAG: 50S ribosomal protein L19 [Leptospiraceae bacterium]|nr:50S ribosomal protein L19 [Leptospiraceae bacterium]MDW8307665.1 50S ribosomal protein L19 [Leptospiraceae bacterium]